MRGTLVIALCATGCFSDHGVAIEVDLGDIKPATVELFVGKDDCTSETAPNGVRCDGIAPMDVTTPLPGAVAFRDASSGMLPQVSGSTVTVQLKSDQAITLPVVIAVGFDANRQPIGTATLHKVDVPASSGRVAKATMVPASSLTSGGNDRVLVWSKATSPSTCVAVEHWDKGQLVSRDFVVPRDDLDCDGTPNASMAECNANAYDAMYAGGQGPLPNCFGRGPSEFCLLGSLACTDGTGPTAGTCAPQSPQHDQGPVCVPSQFCNSTCTSLEPTCPLTLIRDLTLQVPRIDCHVPVGPDGAACPGNNSGPILLDTAFGPTARCDQQPLLGALQFADLPTTSAHTFSGAAMELGSPNAPCNFAITWKSGTRTSGALDDQGIIQLQSGERKALLPIVFHFEANGSCQSTLFTCSPTTSASASTDPLWTCVRGQ